MTFSFKRNDDTVNRTVHQELMDIEKTLNVVYIKDLVKNWCYRLT